MSKGGTLTVADFFCGAGGFSEGFRQAGFKIAFALDNWKPAIETHTLNHPGTTHALMSILDLDTPEKIDEVVPDTDVIIGSPPCVSFSGSNKAGKADKSLGIRLIEAYLRIVAWKLNKPGSKLKYWAMENVPNSANYVKRKYSFADLGLPGGKKTALELPTWEILNAADFGAPQTRRRFVTGNYPAPNRTLTEDKWTTMRQVSVALGLPWSKNNEVTDPVHGFKLKSSELTDHRYDTRVEEFEWSRAKSQKVDHGYMGKMSFPEDLDRPSRTIMATRSASTREAVILPGKYDGEYRMPTIREVATYMSFPITYQFEGSNESTKYKLVGNAVCCKMAEAIGRSISVALGKQPQQTIATSIVKRPSVDLTDTVSARKTAKPRHPQARFAMHVPGLKIKSCRVELSNRNSNFSRGKYRWDVTLHFGSGANAKKTNVSTAQLGKILSSVSGFKKLVETAERISKRTDSHSFQELYVHRETGRKHFAPDALLQATRQAVDTAFPESVHGDSQVAVPGQFQRDAIPLRVLAAAYVLKKAVDN